MTRKITLKNENKIIIIENDSMEAIVKELVDRYTTRYDRSGFDQVIIYKTSYILDFSGLEDVYESMLFAECLFKHIVKKESKDAVIIYIFLKGKYEPTFVRIN